MTAHELAKQLLAGPDVEIMFAHPAHDHWRTELASKIDSITEEQVKYTEYHRQDKVVEFEYGEEVEDARTVLVIR
jgi:hypothetical protein